jgi:hypothetical protein
VATVNGITPEQAKELRAVVDSYAYHPCSETQEALDAFIDSLTVEPAVEQHFVCGECGYVWPMNMFGAPWLRKRHGEQFRNDETCPGYFTLVPHHPTPCYCKSYGPDRCPQHAPVEPPTPAEPMDVGVSSRLAPLLRERRHRDEI